MKTDTENDDGGVPPTEISTDVIFDLLAHTRRRHALYYLNETVGSTTLYDLSDALTVWESVPSDRRRERIATGLYHRHLPKLTEAGVVRYDEATDSIELQPAASVLTPYLDLAGSTDRQCGE